MSTISLLCYFAANAPAEIPAWFADENDGLPPLPALPDHWQLLQAHPAYEALGQAEKDELSCWLRDGTWDLAPTQAKIGRDVQQAMNDARRAREQERDHRLAARYFRWRWHYAKVMLKSGGMTEREPALLLLAEARALVERLRGMAIHESHYAALEAAIAKAGQA